MTIKFYSMKDPRNTLNKTKTGETTMTGTLKEPCSLTNPVIKIKKDMSILSKNYCFIQELGRYYYIDAMTFEGTLTELSLSVDVLESFKDDICRDDQTIGRHETQYNLDVPDNKLIFKEGKTLQSVNVGAYSFDVDSVADNSKHFFVMNVSNLIP